jgi:hypothetical protein
MRLVCVAVNFGMAQWGEEVFLTLAQAVVEREKQRKQNPIMLGRPDIRSALRLPKCWSKYIRRIVRLKFMRF